MPPENLAVPVQAAPKAVVYIIYVKCRLSISVTVFIDALALCGAGSSSLPEQLLDLTNWYSPRSTVRLLGLAPSNSRLKVKP